MVGCSSETEEASEDRVPGKCQVDANCDDGIFCNGVEVCRPSSDEANGLGCVAGETPWCNDGVECTDDTCNVLLDRCEHEPPDEDGDGAISDECCNGELCGDDCNDERFAQRPLQPEFCDEVDNDCHSFADEGGQCPGEVGGTPVGAPGLSTSDPITEVTIQQLCCGSADRCKWAKDGVCDCPTRVWDLSDCSEDGGGTTGGGGGDGRGQDLRDQYPHRRLRFRTLLSVHGRAGESRLVVCLR